MANIGQYVITNSLNFWLTPVAAAAVTRPTGWGIGLSLGVPSSTSGSEIGATSNYSRLTAGGATPFSTCGAAASSVTNNANVTFGPLSAASLTGIQIWDNTAAGSMLYYGTLTTARTLIAGDSLVIASGALTVSLG